MKSIHRLATQKKVHIIVVAHSNKCMTFLHKENISGSGDMANFAENIFIVHRVNNDFQKRFPEFIGQEKAVQYFKYENVLEVVENRDLGVVDFYVGSYYEMESKRFLNDFTDNPCYGRQKSIMKEEPQINYPLFDYAISEKEFLSEPIPTDQLPF